MSESEEDLLDKNGDVSCNIFLSLSLFLYKLLLVFVVDTPLNFSLFNSSLEVSLMALTTEAGTNSREKEEEKEKEKEIEREREREVKRKRKGKGKRSKEE